jgi:cation/acetate symporter
MEKSVYQRMRTNPKFAELVRRRSRFAWTLSAVVLTLFYGFVLVVAFAPQVLGQPLSADSPFTVGLVLELGMFVLFWVLTAVYVRRANTEFDALTQDIVREAHTGAAR